MLMKTNNRFNSALLSSQIDGASATKAVDSGTIPGLVKPKAIKIDVHSFPA